MVSVLVAGVGSTGCFRRVVCLKIMCLDAWNCVRGQNFYAGKPPHRFREWLEIRLAFQILVCAFFFFFCEAALIFRKFCLVPRDRTRRSVSCRAERRPVKFPAGFTILQEGAGGPLLRRLAVEIRRRVSSFLQRRAGKV